MRWLAVVILSFACAGCVTTKAEWDPAAYREAVRRGDDKEMGRLARAAEREQALVGLARERVHELLGKPPYVNRGAYVDDYPAGWQNQSYVLDDQASLYVEYDRAWRRVVRISQTSRP